MTAPLTRPSQRPRVDRRAVAAVNRPGRQHVRAGRGLDDARMLNRWRRRTVAEARTTPAGVVGADRVAQGRSPLWLLPGLVLGWLVVTQTVGLAAGSLWSELVSPLLLAVAGIAICRRLARRESTKALVRLVRWSFVAKLVGTLARYLIIVYAYGGVGDSRSYAKDGLTYARAFRSFDFGMRDTQGSAATGNIRYITGVAFTVFGSSEVVGFLVFGLVSWLGLWCFYRAFQIAVPNGNHKRYALLVFYLPSLLFWPSSIGKDAFVGGCLGLCALGTARLATRQRGAFVLIAAGLLGVNAIRPHVALIAVIAALVCLVRRPSNGLRFNRSAKVLALAPALLAAGAVFGQVQSLLNLDQLGADAVEEAKGAVTGRTDEGGSAFEPRPVSNAAELPFGVLTVVYRPLPVETNSPLALLLSLESTALLGYTILRLASVGRGLASTLRNPYVAAALVYSLLFVVAFSTIANFGILARQRAQVLPLFLVFLAIDRARPRAALEAA